MMMVMVMVMAMMMMMMMMRDELRWDEMRCDDIIWDHLMDIWYMIYDMIWYDMRRIYDSDHPRPCIHACLGTIFRAPWERFDTLRNDSADPAFILWFGLAESFLGHALRPDLKTPSKSSQTRKSSEETCSCFPLIEQLKDRDIEHSSYRAIERSNGRWIERVSGWNIERSRSSDRAFYRSSDRAIASDEAIRGSKLLAIGGSSDRVSMQMIERLNDRCLSVSQCTQCQVVQRSL